MLINVDFENLMIIGVECKKVCTFALYLQAKETVKYLVL